jgi:alpha/beta superfamily hydrolase
MSPRPPVAERLSIEGPAGPIEAVIEDPGTPETAFAVVCHPHPLFGGTMENKVVTTLARAFHEVGMPTVRFNFRGVGASAGSYDKGLGETGDADAAVAWGARRWPGRPLVIAGFSFGAYVALRLTQQRKPQRLITVAPPVARFDFRAQETPRIPWLIIQGDADEVVDPATVQSWAHSLLPRPRLIVMPGVGHFFHGRLNALRAVVTEEIRSG